MSGNSTRGSNAESQQAIRAERARDNNIASFYCRYLSGLAHGDLGFSRSLNRPVSELLKERLPLTLDSLAYGVLGGDVDWAGSGDGSRFGGVRRGRIWCRPLLSGLCLALPAARDRAGLSVDGRRRPLGHRAGGFPARLSLCQESAGSDLSSAPRSGGTGQRLERLAGCCSRMCSLLRRPQLAALAGISVSLAFGASIPIEVICDTPGIGQLAWQAALDRDLPLLVTITVLVALMTLVVNSLCRSGAGALEAVGRTRIRMTRTQKLAIVVLGMVALASLAAGCHRAVVLCRTVSRCHQRSAIGALFAGDR